MRKRHLTLVELMIVIVLITVIGSVVAYNLRGSLEEGKRFKTVQGGAQIYNILMLEKAKGADIQDWEEVIRTSPLAKNGEGLIRDGWGQPYHVEWSEDQGEYLVTSERYSRHVGNSDGAFLR